MPFTKPMDGAMSSFTLPDPNTIGHRLDRKLSMHARRALKWLLRIQARSWPGLKQDWVLSSLRPYVEEALSKENPEREETLKALVNRATRLRQEAVRQGARSHSHPEWAAAASCESWLRELLLGNNESISRVEKIIQRLEKR